MTTSATTAYNLSAQDMIDLALTDIGVFSAGVTNDADMRPIGLKLLNILLKSVDAMGAPLWDITRRTQALTSGTASYALASDVSDIEEVARYTASGATYGSQVTSMVRDEYMTLPDRTTQGTPFRYFAEKSLNAAGIQVITLYLYPVPPTTGDALEYAAVIRMQDVTGLNQTLSIPQKWLSALRFGLAASLAIPFGLPVERVSQLNKRYQDELSIALEDDNERGSLQIVPFGTSYAGTGRYT